MTIQAKQKLVTDVAEEIGDFLTVKDTRKVSAILTEQLDQYEVTEIKAEEISEGTLDLLQMFLDAKRIEGRSVKTIERYSYILEKALRSIGVPAEQITVFNIRSFLMQESRKACRILQLKALDVFCLLSSVGHGKKACCNLIHAPTSERSNVRKRYAYLIRLLKSKN